MPQEPDGRILWLMRDVGGDLEAIPPAPAWFAQAACRDHPPELWFPEKGHNATAAKAICAVCPVAEECLTFALDELDGDRAFCFGIFGGLGPQERFDLARERRSAA